MSMSAQGISRLYWVWRWRNGFASSSRPAIHIFAGLNVCIQVISPTHAGSAFASAASWRMPSEPVRTGLTTTRTGIDADSSSAAAICRRVVGDVVQRLGAVEVLAAGDEPDLGRR